jgi:hypothetical protein
MPSSSALFTLAVVFQSVSVGHLRGQILFFATEFDRDQHVRVTYSPGKWSGTLASGESDELHATILALFAWSM